MYTTNLYNLYIHIIHIINDINCLLNLVVVTAWVALSTGSYSSVFLSVFSDGQVMRSCTCAIADSRFRANPNQPWIGWRFTELAGVWDMTTCQLRKLQNRPIWSAFVPPVLGRHPELRSLITPAAHPHAAAAPPVPFAPPHPSGGRQC